MFGLTAIALFVLKSYGPEYIGAMPLAALGVAVYFATESFGSLVIALFWSFAVSCNRTDEAKRAFPFMIAVAQIGTIGGSSLLVLGMPNWAIYSLCTVTTILIMVAINKIITTIPASQLVSDKV